jgi:hypothetical protein
LLEPPELTLAVVEEDEPYPGAADERSSNDESNVGRPQEERHKRPAAGHDRRHAQETLHPPM